MPVCTSIVPPLFANGTALVTLVVPVVTDFRKVPALVKEPKELELVIVQSQSALKRQPDWLLNSEPLLKMSLPPVQCTVPRLLIVRLLEMYWSAGPAIISCAPKGIVNVPAW